MATVARLRREEELLCLLLLLRQHNKRKWSTRPLCRSRREEEEEEEENWTDKDGGTDSDLPEDEVALEESQSTNLPSASPDLGRISSSGLENIVEPDVEETCPALSGGKRKASWSMESGPDVKRWTEDMDLKRLENIDEGKATHKDTEDARFVRVIVDMLKRIPDNKREEIQFKVYQLLNQALHSDAS